MGTANTANFKTRADRMNGGWSAKDLGSLLELFGSCSIEEIAERIGRKGESIHNKCVQIGLFDGRMSNYENMDPEIGRIAILLDKRGVPRKCIREFFCVSSETLTRSVGRRESGRVEVMKKLQPHRYCFA